MLTCLWKSVIQLQYSTQIFNHPSIYLCLSLSLADRWGTTVDFTTSFLHPSRFSAFCSMIFHLRPLHSLMVSSHRFLCLPLRLPPWTVPCRIVLASPDDRVTWPYHFSLRLFTNVRRSSYDPMAFPILAFTSSLVITVGDTEEFEETSHLQCLYPSFNVCCYGPRFTCIQKYGHGQETHQSDLGANVLVVPDDFKFDHCSSGLGYAGEYFRLGSLIWLYSSQIFKTSDGLRFLLSMVMSVLMPLVLFVIWVFSALISMPYALEASSRWYTNLTSPCSCPTRLSMSSAKRL